MGAAHGRWQLRSPSSHSGEPAPHRLPARSYNTAVHAQATTHRPLSRLHAREVSSQLIHRPPVTSPMPKPARHQARSDRARAREPAHRRRQPPPPQGRAAAANPRRRSPHRQQPPAARSGQARTAASATTSTTHQLPRRPARRRLTCTPHRARERPRHDLPAEAAPRRPRGRGEEATPPPPAPVKLCLTEPPGGDEGGGGRRRTGGGAVGALSVAARGRRERGWGEKS